MQTIDFTLARPDDSASVSSPILNLLEFQDSIDSALMRVSDVPSLLIQLINFCEAGPSNLSGKAIKLLYTEALHRILEITNQGVIMEIARVFLAAPETPKDFREAIVEVLTDAFMEDKTVQEDYGIKVLASKRSMFRNIGRAQEQLITTPSTTFAVLSGGAHVVKAIGIGGFTPINMSTTDGQTTDIARLDESSAALMSTVIKENPLQQITIIEDVIDTAATLTRLLIEILSLRRDHMDKSDTVAYSKLRFMIMRLEGLMVIVNEMNNKQTGNVKAESLRLSISYELRDIISHLAQSPYNINLIIAANKLLARQEEIPGIEFLAPSCAQTASGRMLTRPELPWLMGLGLDTAIKFMLAVGDVTLPFEVSIGRSLKDIVALMGSEGTRFPDVPDFRRLQLLIEEVLVEKIGISPEQIIWPTPEA